MGVLQRESVDNQLHSLCEGGVGGQMVIMMVKMMTKFIMGVLQREAVDNQVKLHGMQGWRGGLM